MAVELENAPPCCRQSVERIHDILDAAACLQEFMAVAPSLAKPTPRISFFGALWRLGTGAWSWKKLRKNTSKLLEPIVQNRVTQVIDFELLRHNNDPDLSQQWSRIRVEFQR
jgi:hypothetical protein